VRHPSYLEAEQLDGVVHDFRDAEGQHQDHHQLPIQRAEDDPQVAAVTKLMSVKVKSLCI
jgi:hypothetical protein